MGDTEKTSAEDTENKGTDNLNVNKDEGANQEQTSNEGGGEEKTTEETTQDSNPTNADEEPKTRKRSNIDFILARKDKKIKKLQKEIDGAEEPDDDDDLIDEDDARIIDSRISKIMTPLLERQAQNEDAREIAEFVQNNPDFAQYADKVARYSKHPTRREVPIASLFYEVAGEDLLRIGAERARKADDKAKDSGSGGGSGLGGGEKSVWDLTPEEFEAKQHEVLMRRRD